MGTIKAIISGSTAFLLACCIVSGAMADAQSDKAYCQQLAAQWTKYRAGAGSSAGPTVSEAAILDCTNPTVQIPQIKKGLADMGHGIPDHPDTKLTIEQRVQALEQKNK